MYFLRLTLLTYSNDNKSGSSVQYSQSNGIEDNAIEENGEREAQYDSAESTQGQPRRKRRQNQHENKDGGK